MDGQLYHVEDLQKSEEFPRGRDMARRIGYRTILSVPLLREGKSLGAISVRRLEVHPFNQKQIDLLATFADQAVIAIENVRLFEEAQQRNRELTATSDVLRVISRSPTDIQPVFDVIAESAARLCNSKYAYVHRFDGSLIHFVGAYGLSSDEANSTRRAFPMGPGRGTAGARAILSGKVEYIPDYDLDPEYALKAEAKAANVRSAVAVPMLRDGKPVGAIILDRSQIGYYPDHQVELLKTFADQAVIAIENVSLFKEVQLRSEELSESLQQQTATADVLKAISRSTFDLPVVLRTLAASAANLCDATYAGIMLRESDGLRGGAIFGGTPEEEAEMRSRLIPIDRSRISGRVALSGHIEHIPDILADPDYDFPFFTKHSGSRALMGVPLLREGNVVGVFFLGRPEPGAFSDRHSQLVQTFADQAVIAIENVRLFDEVQARTRELEMRARNSTMHCNSKLPPRKS